MIEIVVKFEWLTRRVDAHNKMIGRSGLSEGERIVNESLPTDHGLKFSILSSHSISMGETLSVFSENQKDRDMALSCIHAKETKIFTFVTVNLQASI